MHWRSRERAEQKRKPDIDSANLHLAANVDNEALFTCAGPFARISGLKSTNDTARRWTSKNRTTTPVRQNGAESWEDKKQELRNWNKIAYIWIMLGWRLGSAGNSVCWKNSRQIAEKCSGRPLKARRDPMFDFRTGLRFSCESDSFIYAQFIPGMRLSNESCEFITTCW